MLTKFNPFHLVNQSPWPILASFSGLNVVLGGLLYVNKIETKIVLMAFLTTLVISYLWWESVHRESSLQGAHSLSVMEILKWGMLLFIASEVFFFISFFWAFFHGSLAPNLELGQLWPPLGIYSFNPMSIPLLNTILLLSSGVSITWCHHGLLKSNYKKSDLSLKITIFLGFVFFICQMFEYLEAPFSMSDACFGAAFFMTTGFHGFHVILGVSFLAVCLVRFKKFSMSSNHMIGFECAAWYWHFVDVVWLFLYLTLYWWGG